MRNGTRRPIHRMVALKTSNARVALPEKAKALMPALD
jgi:hypothetical protein